MYFVVKHAKCQTLFTDPVLTCDVFLLNIIKYTTINCICCMCKLLYSIHYFITLYCSKPPTYKPKTKRFIKPTSLEYALIVACIIVIYYISFCHLVAIQAVALPSLLCMSAWLIWYRCYDFTQGSSIDHIIHV